MGGGATGRFPAGAGAAAIGVLSLESAGVATVLFLGGSLWSSRPLDKKVY